MTIGLVGRKMRHDPRLFTDAGVDCPRDRRRGVGRPAFSQVKNDKSDGYRAVQVTIGARKPSRVPKALAGHFAKANVAAGYTSQEFRLSKSEGEALAIGGELKVDMFTAGQIVDVTGTTVGKGFAGTMKRHNFAGGNENPRQLGIASRPWVHRSAPDARPRLQGQAHVGPHGCEEPHHRELAHR